MFEQQNLISLDTESLDNDKIGRYTTEMREKYPVSFLRHLQNLNFIKLLKMNILQLIISTR